ncbi:MAG: TolC family protein [Proteobacteria bacterium]|nr:TolC family protein [Pseudomonadota bacterium]
MFFVRYIVFFIITLTTSTAFALTLEEAIISAKQQSTEVQIEEKKSELTELSKADAATMFLPNASFNHHDGNRTTTTSTQNFDLKENTRTFTVSQPLFTGFQGVSRVKEAKYKTDAAKESLKAKKSDVSLLVAESYVSIFKLRRIIEIESDQISSYKKILELAKQRLKLKDISYGEYNEYEVKNQNIIIDAEKNKTLLREYELKFENLVKQKPNNIVKPTIASKLESFENVFSSATTDNPKIKSARYSVKAAKSAVSAERGKLLPKISFSLQRDRQKSSYYFGGSSVNSDAAYFDFTIPIFQSGSEYTSIAKANKQKQIAELEHKLAIEEVEKGVSEEYNKFISLRESSASFVELLNGANESLSLAEDRFKKKDIGHMELLLKKVDVADLEKQLTTIEGDALISYFTIKALSGEL